MLIRFSVHYPLSVIVLILTAACTNSPVGQSPPKPDATARDTESEMLIGTAWRDSDSPDTGDTDSADITGDTDSADITGDTDSMNDTGDTDPGGDTGEPFEPECIPDPDIRIDGAIDDNGLTYVWGTIANPWGQVVATFGEGANEVDRAVGGNGNTDHVFFGRYDADGLLEWVQILDYKKLDAEASLTLNVYPAADAVYLHGKVVHGEVQFERGDVGTVLADPDQVWDLDGISFVARFGSTGELEWLRRLESDRPYFNHIYTVTGDDGFRISQDCGNDSIRIESETEINTIDSCSQFTAEYDSDGNLSHLVIFETPARIFHLPDEGLLVVDLHNVQISRYGSDLNLISVSDLPDQFYNGIIYLMDDEMVLFTELESGSLYAYSMVIVTLDGILKAQHRLFDSPRPLFLALQKQGDRYTIVMNNRSYGDEDSLIVFDDGGQQETLTLPSKKALVLAATFSEEGTYLGYRKLADFRWRYPDNQSVRHYTRGGESYPSLFLEGGYDELTIGDAELNDPVTFPSSLQGTVALFDQEYQLLGFHRARILEDYLIDDTGAVYLNAVGKEGITVFNEVVHLSNDRSIAKVSGSGEHLWVASAGRPNDINLMSSQSSTLVNLVEESPVDIGKRDQQIELSSGQDLATLYVTKMDANGDLGPVAVGARFSLVSVEESCGRLHEISHCPSRELSFPELHFIYSDFLSIGYGGIYHDGEFPPPHQFYDAALRKASKWVDPACIIPCDAGEACTWRAECTTQAGAEIQLEINESIWMSTYDFQSAVDLTVVPPDGEESWTEMTFHSDRQSGEWAVWADSQVLDVAWQGEYVEALPEDSAYHFTYDYYYESTSDDKIINFNSSLDGCDIVYSYDHYDEFHHGNAPAIRRVTLDEDTYQIIDDCGTINSEPVGLLDSTTWQTVGPC